MMLRNRTVSRPFLLFCLVALSLAVVGGRGWVAAAQDAPGTSPRPNVLVIVSDDQGWNDIGYHNERMRTPHLDSLAAQGVRLEQFYVHPQCTPTRLSLMTGRFASRFAPRTWTWTNEQAIPEHTLTMARMLGVAGYATGMAGKWHLGSKPRWGPRQYGFDHSYGSLAGGVGVYDHRYRLSRPAYAETWHRNGTFIDEMGHRTTLVADEAVTWIEQHQGESPWFFYAPFHAPHTPMAEGNPKWWQMTRHFARGDRHLYAATLAHLDAAVGRIVDALEATGQREETLIVFFSDNGAVIGDYDGGSYPPPDPKLKAGYASNAPLRAGKKHVYEGGIRVPAFVNWGGTLSSDVVDAPTHVADWMPTFASLSGYDPQGASEWNDPEWDGTDVGPLLRGERTGYAQPRRLYWVWGRGRKREAVREGAWKLIREDGSDWELYNVAEDPREQNDLSASRPQKVKALLDVYQQERAKDWKEGKIESGNPTNR
jgi:arylsulfatase A-like enzyme